MSRPSGDRTAALTFGLALLLVLAASSALARPTAPPATDIERAGATKIEVQGDWLAAGLGGVWLSSPTEKVVRRLDPRSGSTTATIRVPQGPCQAPDVGGGAVWTSTCAIRGLARIDPATAKVTGHVRLPVQTEAEASVGAGAGGVWLVVDGAGCFGCRLVRVDPKSLRVVARIPVAEFATAVRVGYGAVWVTNTRGDLVQKIDPRTKRVVAMTRVGPGPRFLAVGEGGVWTLNQGDGSVTRLDPRTAKVTATIKAGMTGLGGDITAGGGWVWIHDTGDVTGAELLLARIDPRTNRIAERYGPPSGSGGVTVGFGAVWVSAHGVATVWRLPLPKR